MRVLHTATAAVSAAALAGCAPSPPPQPQTPPPALTGEVEQHRAQVESRTADAVLTLPEGAATVRVTAVELLLPGLASTGPGRRDTELTAGRTVAFASGYGAADCGGAPTGEPAALVTVEGVPEPVRVVLDDPHGRAATIHERECAAQRVAAAAPMAWSPQWATEGTRGDLVSLGRLDVGPVAGDEPVTVESIGATTLFRYDAALPVVLAPGERVGLDVRLTPTRCDLHAVAEDKQGFAPQVGLRIGGETLTTAVWVPRDQRAVQKQALLDRCGTG